jgi:hypothetical protein
VNRIAQDVVIADRSFDQQNFSDFRCTIFYSLIRQDYERDSRIQSLEFLECLMMRFSCFDIISNSVSKTNDELSRARLLLHNCICHASLSLISYLELALRDRLNYLRNVEEQLV